MMIFVFFFIFVLSVIEGEETVLSLSSLYSFFISNLIFQHVYFVLKIFKKKIEFFYFFISIEFFYIFLLF